MWSNDGSMLCAVSFDFIPSIYLHINSLQLRMMQKIFIFHFLFRFVFVAFFSVSLLLLSTQPHWFQLDWKLEKSFFFSCSSSSSLDGFFCLLPFDLDLSEWGMDRSIFSISSLLIWNSCDFFLSSLRWNNYHWRLVFHSRRAHKKTECEAKKKLGHPINFPIRKLLWNTRKWNIEVLHSQSFRNRFTLARSPTPLPPRHQTEC